MLTRTSFDIRDGEMIRKFDHPTNPDENVYMDLGGKLLEKEEQPPDQTPEDYGSLLRVKSKLNPVGEVSSYVKKYIYLNSEAEYALIACICILSYCVALFNRIPYLWIQALKGSGKTTLMEVMKPLLCKAMFISEASASSLFRLIHDRKPTLLLDESENLSKRGSSNQMICKILNSGYQKNGAVSRTSGLTPVTYNTYGLKIIAGINPLFETLEDRCIPLRMTQMPEKCELECYQTDNIQQSGNLVETIQAAISNNAEELSDFIRNPKVLGFDSRIKNREFDKWFPVLAIAKIFSTSKKDYFNVLQSYALEQIEMKYKSEMTTPENMCRGIIKDFLADKSVKTKVKDPKFFFFKTDEIQAVIQSNDVHNSYRNKAEITLTLKKIGVETDRRRFGHGPVSLYKIPKSLIH